MHNLPNYWINVKNVKNFMLDDPILDWLNLYGKDNGFKYDIKKKDLFKEYIQKKTEKFRKGVYDNIKKNNGIVVIDKKLDVRKKVSLTLKNIIQGTNIILNGEIIENDLNIHGTCDILIRSDKINNIMNINYEEQKIGCKIHDKFHYVIINLKCIKIKISKKSNILNTKKNIVLKSENILLNNCLNNIQGYKPKKSFIIADKYDINDQIFSTDEYIATIDEIDEKKMNTKIFKSIKWLKELYLYGKNWNIYPPSREELYPNMCNTENDFPWNIVKKEIALKINEITLLWNCGVKQRNYFHQKGVFQWKDNDFNTNHLSFSKEKQNIISKMIDVNHYYQEDLVIYPRKIKKKENKEILESNDVEFIVDFETITMEYSNNKFRGIFMIGCMVIFKEENGIQQEFKQFVSEELTDEEEEKIVKEWIEYMEYFENKFQKKNFKIFHWGKAEQSIYKQINSKFESKKLNFIDLLDIFKTEPIIVKDAFSYGLKDIVKSLHKHGIIKQIWEEEMNGKEAMVQALEEYNTKQKTKVMKLIEKYNYYDCKVIEEILNILRDMI
jgi:flagellar biosynthesis regulator FlbT